MFAVKTDFEKRKSEISEYFSFIEILCEVEKDVEIKFSKERHSKRKRKYLISDQLQKILIANSFLLLYNLIEATVRNSIEEIFSDLKNNETDYTKLTESVKKIFLIQHHKNLKEGTFSLTTLTDQVGTLITSVLNNQVIELQKERLDFSGNLDARAIKKLANDYGFEQPIQNGDDLLTIKNKRNHLAHGEFSFSEIGKNYTVSDLLKFKDQTFDFLGEVIINIDKYISIKGYSI